MRTAAAVVGALLLIGGNAFTAVVERRPPGGLAALSVSATPLWPVVLCFATGERVRRASIAGTFVGFAGTTVLVPPSG